MFRDDPELGFHAMLEEHLRAVRFIFAYAHNYNPDDTGEKRNERTREALKKHRYVEHECPCPDGFRSMEVGPARTVLACKSDHRHTVPYLAVALCALGASIAHGMPEIIGLGVLIALGMLSLVRIAATSYTQFVVEDGEIRAEQKGLIPLTNSTSFARVTTVALGQYCRALGARRVTEIPLDRVDPGDAGTMPAAKGLLFINDGEKTFVRVRASFSQLLWMRNVILEAAKAQGVYQGVQQSRR